MSTETDKARADATEHDAAPPRQSPPPAPATTKKDLEALLSEEMGAIQARLDAKVRSSKRAIEDVHLKSQAKIDKVIQHSAQQQRHVAKPPDVPKDATKTRDATAAEWPRNRTDGRVRRF